MEKIFEAYAKAIGMPGNHPKFDEEMAIIKSFFNWLKQPYLMVNTHDCVRIDTIHEVKTDAIIYTVKGDKLPPIAEIHHELVDDPSKEYGLSEESKVKYYFASTAHFQNVVAAHDVLSSLRIDIHEVSKNLEASREKIQMILVKNFGGKCFTTDGNMILKVNSSGNFEIVGEFIKK